MLAAQTYMARLLEGGVNRYSPQHRAMVAAGCHRLADRDSVVDVLELNSDLISELEQGEPSGSASEASAKNSETRTRGGVTGR